MDYPNGTAGVSINGAGLEIFNAKLLSKYIAKAPSLSPTIYQPRNRSGIRRLGVDVGLLELELTCDVMTGSKEETAEALSHLNAAMSGMIYAKNTDRPIPLRHSDGGVVEIELGDGYIYRCICDDLGQVDWTTDCIATTTYRLQGLKTKSDVTITMPTLPSGYWHADVDSTWPKTDIVVDFAVNSTSAGGHWYMLDIFRADKTQDASGNIVRSGDSRLVCEVAVLIPSGTAVGKVFRIDGVNKRIYRTDTGADLSVSNVVWTDFPFFEHGDNTMTLGMSSGAEYGDEWQLLTNSSRVAVTITYRPTFL